MINDVRKKRLNLRPVTYLSGSQGSESDVPHGYIWSPHLVPKPKGVYLVSHHVLIIYSSLGDGGTVFLCNLLGLKEVLAEW